MAKKPLTKKKAAAKKPLTKKKGVAKKPLTKKKGGAKKPTALKKLEGTYRKDRAPKNEMQPPEINELEKPTALINDFAETEWYKQTRILNELNMLIETDTSLLLAYCNEIGTYFECIKKVKSRGMEQNSNANGKIISNFMKIGNTALANAIKLSDKFGFNPAARTKIEMPEKTKKNGLDKF